MVTKVKVTKVGDFIVALETHLTPRRNKAGRALGKSWPGLARFSRFVSRPVWCHDCNLGQCPAPRRRLMPMEQNFE